MEMNIVQDIEDMFKKNGKSSSIDMSKEVLFAIAFLHHFN
jgi:hypothetical protein